MNHNHSKIFFFIIFLGVFLYACNSPKQEQVDSALLQMPEEFIAFYTKFHQDSTFQMESIIWPLPGKPNGFTDEEIRMSGGFKWTPDIWVMHKPFEDAKNEFDREFEYFAGIIIEFIRVKGTGIGMERRFSKIGDKWMLIYYSAINIMNEVENPNEGTDEEMNNDE